MDSQPPETRIKLLEGRMATEVERIDGKLDLMAAKPAEKWD